MKKTKQITLALLALLAVFGFLFFKQKSGEIKGQKNITLEIVVDEKKVYETTTTTQCTTLAELLMEMKEDGTIQLEYQTTTWGMYIQGLGKDQLYMENPAKGRYWTHDSINNKQCVENNFCDGADSLNIGDGDIFTFTLKNNE